MSERSAEIGFVVQPEPVRTVVKPKAPAKQAANPINGIKREGIKPQMLSIPSIGIEADVLHLGITASGDMAVPDNGDQLSWFSEGYEPGQRGRAVIAGHVDDMDGPAVFWALTELVPGDEILISGEGSELKFIVYSMESVPLDMADVESVFGYQSRPELVLITCSGTYDFDRGTRQERLIVHAALSEE